MASAKIVGSFQIDTTGTRTTEEIIVAGNYDNVHKLINSENFPMRPMPEGYREIVFLKFDRNSTSEKVIVAAKRQGLECPRYEDALLFGEQYPGKQLAAPPVVFLHDPRWRLRAGREVIVLVSYVDGRRDLTLRNFDGWFGDGCWFAFVRKQPLGAS